MRVDFCRVSAFEVTGEYECFKFRSMVKYAFFIGAARI